MSLKYRRKDSVQEKGYTPVECVNDSLRLVVDKKGVLATVVTPATEEEYYVFGKSNKETRAYFRMLKRNLAKINAHL